MFISFRLRVWISSHYSSPFRYSCRLESAGLRWKKKASIAKLSWWIEDRKQKSTAWRGKLGEPMNDRCLSWLKVEVTRQTSPPSDVYRALMSAWRIEQGELLRRKTKCRLLTDESAHFSVLKMQKSHVPVRRASFVSRTVNSVESCCSDVPRDWLARQTRLRIFFQLPMGSNSARLYWQEVLLAHDGCFITFLYFALKLEMLFLSLTPTADNDFG